MLDRRTGLPLRRSLFCKGVKMYYRDTIAAIATPPGEGGISIIRISGDDAIAVADRVFSAANGRPLADSAGYTAHFGSFAAEKQIIDNGIALIYRAPKSYTGENTAELMCHGGETVSEMLLRAVYDSGARPAGAGEFTKRAFLNGKLSLTEAEAVRDIISSRTKQGVAAAVAASGGALYKKTNELKTEILKVGAHIAASLDYPEEDVEPVDDRLLLSALKGVKNQLDGLLAGYETGAAALRGIPTAIAGTPNVGKSTLLNLIAGYERSIVTAIPGTTRDIVEQAVRLGRATLILSDTAGIRETDDEVESIGVRLAREKIEGAQLILCVFDLSRELNSDDRRVIVTVKGRRVIPIINKTDLPAVCDCKYIENELGPAIYISAKDRAALDKLDAEVSRVMGLDHFDSDAPMLANERQRAAAHRAAGHIAEAVEMIENGVTLDVAAISIEAAHGALCELSGENAADSVIEEIFKSFCVGK